MTAIDRGPHRHELVPMGGEWSGFLFDNPQVGYGLRLTWTFTFHYRPVRRDYGTTKPNLSIDWVPFDRVSWSGLMGNHANADRFGEPIEASVYFFEHYRFDAADVRVLDQRAAEVRVGASVRRDLDGLGLEAIEVDHGLAFRGIYVQPSAFPDSIRAAQSLLAEFTDTTGLVGVRRRHNYLFRPADRS